MANRFEEIERGTSSGEGSGPAPRNRFAEIEAPPVPPTPDETKYPSDFMGQLAGTLRMMSNAATLGGRDRLAGLMPGNSYAQEEAKTNQFKKDSPWLSVGGEVAGGMLPAAGLSAGVAKLVPSLAKASIPALMGREAIVGGAMPAVEDVVRGKVPDLGKAAGGAAMGAAGAGVLGTLAKYNPFSASFKMRQAGNDLTPADKEAMVALAQRSGNQGIPLNLPELATEVAPGRAAGLESTHGYHKRMENGGIAARNFDAAREGPIRGAVDRIKGLIGNGPSDGLVASRAAEKAIKDHGSLVRESARPDYDASMGVRVPERQTTPNIIETRKEVYGDRVLGPVINNADPNSVQVLQHTADAIEGQIKTESNPAKLAILTEQKRGIMKQLEEASPEFARAQATTAAGRGVGEEIAAGPLGAISSTNKPMTQSNAIFNVDSPAEVAASKRALERLRVASNPPKDPSIPFNPNFETNYSNAVPEGLLAARIDDAAKDPTTFGRKVMPRAETGEVIQDVVGDQKFGLVKDLLEGMRARDVAGRPAVENSDGPLAGFWNSIQNLSSGRMIDALNNPSNIEALGTVGPIQGLLNSGSTSAGTEIGGNVGENVITPLIIDIIKNTDRRKKEREEDKR